jgi:ribosomal protein L37E
MHNFNLVENAKDSLSHAIEHLSPVNRNTTGDWKRIIVDLAHVVELLFKERLRRVHPAFVFNDIDKYPSNNAFTVGAEKAFVRLQKIDNLKFSESDKKAVKVAREKRNEIEHFEFSIENHEAKVLVGQVLSFILMFAEEQLELEWNSLCFKGGKWWILYEYKEFYESLIKTVQEKIEDKNIPVIECSSCHNESFDIDEEECLICGHNEEVLNCKWCEGPYIYSTCEYVEEAELCPNCECKEGQASTHEKY